MEEQILVNGEMREHVGSLHHDAEKAGTQPRSLGLATPCQSRAGYHDVSAVRLVETCDTREQR